MKKVFLSAVAVLCLAVIAHLPSQAQEKPAVDTQPALRLDDSLSLDHDIIYGKLDNGLTYYIKVNKRPENRAELRLAVNAGSVLEDDDQQGLAHLGEHMAFNGTKHFEKQALVKYLESTGTRFGPDLNAYTSFDEVVYMLQVPTDSIELVTTGLQILEDWAHNVSYDNEEIDKERNVVIEEWRLGRGANARMRDKQFPIIFKGSQYADRLPIGKKEVVESSDYETVKRFYRDWYRPDLLAVIAVGDFDPVWMEGLIKEHFSRLPRAESPRERTVFAVPEHDETLFAIATDPEATNSQVTVYYKHPLTKTATVADYRRDIVQALYNGMINQRLHELTLQADPPITYGYSAKGSFVRSTDVYVLSAGVQDGGVERGLATLLAEAERVKRYGFTESELERQKKETLRRFERMYNERDKTESRQLASEYIRNFLSDEPAPGIAYEYGLYQQYVPTITLDEINALAGKWIRDKSRVVAVNSPEKPDLPVPTKDDLLAVFADVRQQEILPYQDATTDRALIENPPTASAVVSEEYLEPIGVTKWTLGNGIKVILKPTDFKNDEVRFNGFSSGGTSLIPDEDYIPAMTASMVIQEGGIGDFNQIELQKMLAGQVVRVSPWISDLEEGFSGEGSPKDLETIFQLIYLYATEPRLDETTYEAWRSRITAYLENRRSNPELVFRDTVQVTMAQHHPREQPLSLATLDAMDLNKSFDFYRDRFADADDFTFVFVGNFDLEKIKPLVETYLGGLPVTDREETWRDVGIDPPTGIIDKTVKKGLEPKGRVQFIFSGDFDWTPQNRYDLESMTSAFRIKLREVLREDLGGTYGVRVSARPSHYPNGEYQLSIAFGCDPARIDELSATVMTQVDSLREFGLPDEYVQKVQEIQRRTREKDLKENRFWLTLLTSRARHGEDPLDVLKFDETVAGLNAETIKNTARRYFNLGNYVKVVLLPEG